MLNVDVGGAKPGTRPSTPAKGMNAKSVASSGT
jgi:hypothetical protein